MGDVDRVLELELNVLGKLNGNDRVSADGVRRWPSEEVWKARKRSA